MKNKKVFLGLVSLLMLAFQPAQAISLRFKFKTFSSGPSIYACNAGLLSKPVAKNVCYFEGTQNTCTATDCTDGKICNTRCVCTGNSGGDHLMNYGQVTIENWKDNGNTAVTGLQTKTLKAGQANYNVALSDSESWNKSISQLSFNLGSELYGSSYFVDVCYRGPQIEYHQDGITSYFSSLAQASATDFLANAVNPGDNSRDGLVIPGLVDGKKYSELAGLTMQAFLVCDLQGMGVYQTSNVSGAYNTTQNEAVFTLGGGNLPIGGGDLFKASSVVAANASAVNLISNVLTDNSTKAPRFCKIRYVFTETNAFAQLPNLRKWQRHGAEMCTYSKIEEDAK
ncbi:MAG: protease [Bdellovibrionales bacterium]